MNFLDVKRGKTLFLGMQGDNGALTLRFEKHFVDYNLPENGEYSLLFHNPVGGIYERDIETDADHVLWTVLNEDTQYEGNGEVELRYTFGEDGEHYSEIWTTFVSRSLVENGQSPAPVTSGGSFLPYADTEIPALKSVQVKRGKAIFIGMQGDHDVTTLVFDRHFVDYELPAGGNYALIFRNPDGGIYPRVIRVDDEHIYWTVLNEDTQYKGEGEVQLRYMFGDDGAFHSEIWPTVVAQSLTENGGTPAPYQSWVDEVTRQAAAAENAAEAAQEASEHYPYIDATSRNWMAWNVDAGVWFDTGVHAQGPQGEPYEHSEEFTRLADQVRSDATAAASSATAAANSSAAAAALAEDAADSEEEARIHAAMAGVYKNDANAAKNNANNAAAAAISSANTATDAATEAAGSATVAARSAAAAAAILEEFTTPTATAETLEPGSEATASYADGHFTFGIPNGNPGSQVSVSAEGTATDEVQYITIDGVEKKLAGGGYEPPTGGIPETDLASAVQTKLNEKEVKWAAYGVTSASTIHSWVANGYNVKCRIKTVIQSGSKDTNIYDVYDLYNSEYTQSGPWHVYFANEEGFVTAIQYYRGGSTSWSKNTFRSSQNHRVLRKNDISTSDSTSEEKVPSAKYVHDALDAITGKIPDVASSTNKLVSASEMGDAIEAVEAKQLYATNAQGSFATKAALTAATIFYNADGTVATPTKNDVAYVLADESHSGKSAKYVIASVDPIVWGFVITFSDKTYVHRQTAAQAVWSVQHDLDKFPSVTVVDSTGEQVVGAVEYLNANLLTLTFSSAFSGEAYCN